MAEIRKLTISIIALLRASANRNNSVFVLLSIMIVLLIVDTSISRTTSVVVEHFSVARFATFVLIGITAGVTQYFILRFVRKESISARMAERIHFNIIHRIIELPQYLLTAIFLFVVLQMFF